MIRIAITATTRLVQRFPECVSLCIDRFCAAIRRIKGCQRGEYRLRNLRTEKARLIKNGMAVTRPLPEPTGRLVGTREDPSLGEFSIGLSVPGVGFEPTRHEGHWILSPARLPIPPPGPDTLKIVKPIGPIILNPGHLNTEGRIDQMNDRTTRVRGGTIQTPTGGLKSDLLISGEKITALLDPSSPISADQEIDAQGRWVLPGLIDLHAHTRSPGYEQKEDFLTASRAAAAGGYTTFVDMPNVEPPP